MQVQVSEKWPRVPVSPQVMLRPCGGCGFTFCRCPRKGWGVTAANSTVQPGKGTKPPEGGGVHSPVKGRGGRSLVCR
jgi:hypothetical protein